MTETSRLGQKPQRGITSPVEVETTENITLAGLQNINGFELSSGDRVLVKDQDDATENGIYAVSTTAWERASDFNDSSDVVNGLLVMVSSTRFLYEIQIAGAFAPGVTEVTAAEFYNNFRNVIKTAAQTATAGQTVFLFPEITDQTADIVVAVANGAALRDGYSVTPGQIEFDTGRNDGDEVWALIQYTTPIGSTTASAVTDTSRGQSVQETVNNSVQAVDTLAELKALPAFDGAHARINLGGRAGPFRATTDNKTAEIASDPQEGIYVAGDGVTWVRQYGQTVDSTPEVKFEWFGAVGDGVTNNDAACEAAYTFGGRVNVTHGAVFGIQNITVPSGAITVGSGTIKWLSPDLNNMFELQDVDGTTFDGVTVDVNNVAATVSGAGQIMLCKGTSTRDLTIKNCKFLNCFRSKMLRHEDNTLANYNVKITGNIFDAGTEDRHDTHFNANLNQMYGFEFTHNLLRNLAAVSTTTSSGHVQPNADETPGDFIITNNICTGFSPNALDDAAQISMYLIRSTTTAGSIPNRKLIFSNNITSGGKKGLSFAENEDQTFSEVVIDANVFKNHTNGGLSVGRNNDNQNILDTTISNNTVAWDLAYMESVAPGSTSRGISLISIEASNVSCIGNTVKNAPHSGIFVWGEDCLIEGNRIDNFGINQAALDDNFEYGGGVWLYIAPRCSVVNNKIIGGGFTGDTKRAHGIAVHDNPNNADSLISGNTIQNIGDKLVSAISLSRFAGGTRSKNITVHSNKLIGFENSGKIIARSLVIDDNSHHIYNNKGWGYEQILWNPGTVAAGATATVTINTDDGYVLDNVGLTFDGFRVDSVGNPSDWALDAAVTTGADFWTAQTGVITVYLKNNTGSSQTFTQDARLKVWLERRNNSEAA